MSDPLDEIKVYYRFSKEEVQTLYDFFKSEALPRKNEKLMDIIRKITVIIYGPESER